MNTPKTKKKLITAMVNGYERLNHPLCVGSKVAEDPPKNCKA